MSINHIIKCHVLVICNQYSVNNSTVEKQSLALCLSCFPLLILPLHQKQAGRSHPESAASSGAKKNSVMSVKHPPAALQIKPKEH